jgi:hypothetical protein
MGALLLTGVHEDITMLEWEERFLPRHVWTFALTCKPYAQQQMSCNHTES